MELVLEAESDIEKNIDEDARLDDVLAGVGVEVVVNSVEDIMVEILIEYEGVSDGFPWTAVVADCVVWLG